MTIPMMEHPRVAAALRELGEAIKEAAELHGSRFDAAAVIVAFGGQAETALLGCKCDDCLANISYALGDCIAKKMVGKRSEATIKPLAGMH